MSRYRSIYFNRIDSSTWCRIFSNPPEKVLSKRELVYVQVLIHDRDILATVEAASIARGLSVLVVAVYAGNVAASC